MLHDPNQNKLFPKLSEEALQKMQEHGTEISLNAGDVLFSEGEVGYDFSVVLEGEIEITKQVGGETKLLTIHRRGDFMGEISMLTGAASIAAARALTAAKVLQIESDTFKQIIAECSPLADVILTAMIERSKDVELQLRQQEKLAALGKLSAGLAHELNNPAAAGTRSASKLRENLDKLQSLTWQLNSLGQKQLDFLAEFERSCQSNWINNPIKLDPLTQSDKEDEVAEWLENHNINNAWKIAPTFVYVGIDIQKLDNLAENIPEEKLGLVINWLETTFAQTCLLNEIEQSTSRISELVQAVKNYSYMDKGSLQEVDIHEGIDNTLIIFGHKLKKGITVKREYDQSLPRITAYGSELNQVWTNLIDNAIDAMDSRGLLTIKTTKDKTCIVIEFTDTGVGIPKAIQSRIFEPFFTTKDVGAGTGLGLDIAYRIITKKHKGDIHFESQPGQTCFRIYLPIDQSHHTACRALA